MLLVFVKLELRMALETNVTKLVNVHKFDIVLRLNFLHQFVRYTLFLVKLMDPVPIVSVICDCFF